MKYYILMAWRIVFFMSLALLVQGSYAQTTASNFQSFLDSIVMSNPSAIGVLAHVESPDQNITWSGSAGYSEAVERRVLHPDQPALTASNTKTFVSATILRLVELRKLSIEDPIKEFLTNKTRLLFQEKGYDLDAITIKHLLSHTSGIENFANQYYIDFINSNKKYRWTRDEQLSLTLKAGPPLGPPESVFSYSDANYLLLTEVIEHLTGQPFYTAMRNLLKYNDLNIKNTWFPTLEERPANTKPLAHQYWETYKWDTYDLDVSVDLYGGGGIAATTRDLAVFIHQLFNYKIVTDTTVFNQIFTEVSTKSAERSYYGLGISFYEYRAMKAYGHGGFWGTRVLYFPEINTSIAIYILERDQRKLTNDIIRGLLDRLKEKR